MTRFVQLTLVVILSLSLGACGIFGGGSKDSLTPKTTAIGVNGYLWQATLDTLSFMPIDQAEPAGGVILTDWQMTPDVDNERVKVTVRFLSETLRSDGIKVTVIRQQRRGDDWIVAPVQATTVLQIEEAILARARAIKSGEER
jgi:hypothetical protein